jgi:H+-transporting ATPase
MDNGNQGMITKDKQSANIDETQLASVDIQKGLTGAEAEARLAKYGTNELQEKHVNPIFKFISYFWGPIPWMIEVAAILSILVHHWADFIIITIMLVVNACIGFWEEFQAGNTIEALKSTLAIKARVLRDGEWTSLPAKNLVPGDVIRLRAGDIIPADARLLDEDPLQVDQSALTGESLPVKRGKGEDVYSGSAIKRGEAVAQVTATGAATYFGKTAQLVSGGSNLSHLHKAILKIGDFLIFVAVFLLIIILAVAAFRGENLATTLQFALVLMVAAIPIAMPTVLSVTLAAGARLLAAKKAIVTRLASIEELAGIDILCSDKTGTLTRNELSIADPVTYGSISADDLIMNAALASRIEDNDPIDKAIYESVKDQSKLSVFKIIKFVPFDPVNKRTEAEVATSDGGSYRVSKGAPQVILDLSANKNEVEKAARDEVNSFAKRGYRSLGVARTDTKGAWEFLGIIPLHDPPRDDSKDTIKNAGEMGISVKMVTGDQTAIAIETARLLELGTNIIEIPNRKDIDINAILTPDKVEHADGFAQVFPEHKYRIVEGLQHNHHMVGMTGDGVNDAPALKKADVGVAVSGATDAARAASDIVLLDKGLSVIIDAVKESRKIFERMKSYAIYRIAETIRILLFMTLSILAFNFYPITAVMIVLLALLNDGAIISIAYDNAPRPKQPQSWNLATLLPIATVLGVIGVVESFTLFFIAEKVFHFSRDFIQTMIYLKLSVAGHLTIFVARTQKPFWASKPSKPLLLAIIGTQIVATTLASFGLLMTPIGLKWAGLIWAYALFWVFIEDGAKIWAYRAFHPDEHGILGRNHVFTKER